MNVSLFLISQSFRCPRGKGSCLPGWGQAGLSRRTIRSADSGPARDLWCWLERFQMRMSKEILPACFLASPLGSNCDSEFSDYMLDSVYLNFLKQAVRLGCNRPARFLYCRSHVSPRRPANTNTSSQAAAGALWWLCRWISVDKFAFSA